MSSDFLPHLTGHAIERYRERVENLPGERPRPEWVDFSLKFLGK